MAKPCRTGKIRYRDKIGALFAMSQAHHKDSSKRAKTEQRAYLCPACRGWHLTSWG